MRTHRPRIVTYNIYRSNVRRSLWANNPPSLNIQGVSLSKERVYGPFFVMEPTIAGIVYLDMLQQVLMKMTKKDAFTSSKTAHPLIHYLGEMRDYLSTRCPGPWIILAWPSHSLVLTPLDILNRNYPR
jgi:hypothetical protein